MRHEKTVLRSLFSRQASNKFTYQWCNGNFYEPLSGPTHDVICTIICTEKVEPHHAKTDSRSSRRVDPI